MVYFRVNVQHRFATVPRIKKWFEHRYFAVNVIDYHKYLNFVIMEPVIDINLNVWPRFFPRKFKYGEITFHFETYQKNTTSVLETDTSDARQVFIY